MKDKMMAVLKERAEKGFTVKDVPIPKIGANDLLVKIGIDSFCGTDSHIYEWDAWSQSRIKPPQIGGHEMGGEVIEIGKDVEGFEEGDYVSAETHIFDDSCYQCKIGNRHICENVKILGVDVDGVWAEYAKIPAKNAWKGNPSIPKEWVSVQEPFGNAVHTVFNGNNTDVSGNTVLIAGCGPIGVCAIAIAKAAGAEKVIATEVNDFRIKLAKRMGADTVLNPKEVNIEKEILSMTDGRGVDLFCEISGNANALNQGLGAVRPGGRVSILGVFPDSLNVDITKDIVFKGINIQGINGRLIWDTWIKTDELLGTKKVDISPVITHKMKLEEANKAAELMKTGNCSKILLYP